MNATLTIMTYNIKNCIDGRCVNEIASDIEKESPDIVCVQEIDKDTQRAGGRDLLKELADKLHMNAQFYQAMPFMGGEYGIGILSRYPLEETRLYPLEVRPEDEPRSLGHARIQVDGRKIHIYNTHLSFEDTKKRLEQFAYLNQQLSDQKNFILCGDFNISGYEEYDCLKRFQMVNRADRRYDSFIGGGQEFCAIDNILVSDEMKIISCKMADTSASDHRPLVAEVEFCEDCEK